MSAEETIITLFQLAAKGKLTEIEQQHIIQALVSFGNSTNPEEVDEVFKNIRTGSRNLLEQTENCIDSALSIVKSYNNYFEEAKISIQSLPDGAIYGDDKETLEFIKSLEEGPYNYSQAEKLIGVSRQTIKKHADTNKYGLKAFSVKKSQYISREALIGYYREYFNKHGYGF
jgi:hypothetical protein